MSNFDSTPFSNLFKYVDKVTDSYIISTSQDLTTFITPIFTSLLIIWITIWGFSLILGRTQESLGDGVVRVIKISFIITLGLTVGIYNSVVVSFIQGFPETIAGVLITGSYTSSGALDSLYLKVFQSAKSAFDAAGIWNGNVGMYFIAAGIIAVGIWLVLVTGSLILLSQLAMAVLLGLGPIFIIMLLFNSTQRFFESWLSMLINFALILILATAIGALIIELADTYMDSTSGVPTFGGAATMVVVFLFGVIVMQQVQAIAAALGGGISLATNGAASGIAKGVTRSVGNLSPRSVATSLKRRVRSTQGNYNAARSVDRGAMKAARAVKHAYQKKFGKGNSISS